MTRIYKLSAVVWVLFVALIAMLVNEVQSHPLPDTGVNCGGEADHG